MGMAGNVQSFPKFDDCECGKKGFKSETDARKYMLNKRRVTEPVDMVECPVGNCLHCFNPTIRPRDEYLRFLTETSSLAPQRRPALPPSRPLTQSLPLRSVPVEPASPPSEVKPAPPASAPPLLPSPSPPESRSCPKVKYASEAVALFALEGIPEERGELRAYHCTTCGKWHLTSKEYEPADLVEEEIVTFGHEPWAVTVVAARYPDGKVASITLRNARGQVRVRTENFPQLASALAFVEQGRDEPRRSRRRPGPARIDRQRQVLDELQSGPTTTRQIAERLEVSSKQALTILDRLEQRGLAAKDGTVAVGFGAHAVLWRAVEGASTR